MSKILKGILYDIQIELEEDPKLPSGIVVPVKIEPQELSLEEGSTGLVGYTSRTPVALRCTHPTD